mmetsp:Transcript_17543/g.34088  ORF Transcript_17543/g.34088 Transcript_17543/m.34088 type:complete len:104 (-) Transcript_17543:8-319(-)
MDWIEQSMHPRYDVAIKKLEQTNRLAYYVKGYNNYNNLTFCKTILSMTHVLQKKYIEDKLVFTHKIKSKQSNKILNDITKISAFYSIFISSSQNMYHCYIIRN